MDQSEPLQSEGMFSVPDTSMDSLFNSGDIVVIDEKVQFQLFQVATNISLNQTRIQGYYMKPSEDDGCVFTRLRTRKTLNISTLLKDLEKYVCVPVLELQQGFLSGHTTSFMFSEDFIAHIESLQQELHAVGPEPVLGSEDDEADLQERRFQR